MVFGLVVMLLPVFGLISLVVVWLFMLGFGGCSGCLFAWWLTCLFKLCFESLLFVMSASGCWFMFVLFVYL